MGSLNIGRPFLQLGDYSSFRGLFYHKSTEGYPILFISRASIDPVKGLWSRKEAKYLFDHKALALVLSSANNNRDKEIFGCYIGNMSSINQILQEAIQLPEDQRLTLVHRLLMLGEPHTLEGVKHAWDIEIHDRIIRYDRGEIRSRPAGEVFSDLDRRLKP